MEEEYGILWMNKAKPESEKKVMLFQKWTGKMPGKQIQNYRKPLIDKNDKAIFAEIEVVERLLAGGWNAVWVDSYFRKYWQAMPKGKSGVKLPPQKQELLDSIRKNLGCYVKTISVPRLVLCLLLPANRKN